MRSFAFYREKFLRIFQPQRYRLLTESVAASKQNNFVCIVIAYRSIIGIVSKNISLRKLELSVRRKAMPYCQTPDLDQDLKPRSFDSSFKSKWILTLQTLLLFYLLKKYVYPFL